MKIKFKLNIRSYSGKLGNMVFYNYFNYHLCLSRKYRYPKLSSHHEDMRAINRNINNLYLQTRQEYKNDFIKYCMRSNMENNARSREMRKRMPSAKVVFTQCIWKWANEQPYPIDLKSLSISDLVSAQSPLCRVSSCIEAAYLKPVTNWQAMNSFISE